MEKSIFLLIKKQIIEELKTNFKNDGNSFFLEVLNEHIEKIKNCYTEKQLNSYLIRYRQLTLKEWIESLSEHHIKF